MLWVILLAGIVTGYIALCELKEELANKKKNWKSVRKFSIILIVAITLVVSSIYSIPKVYSSVYEKTDMVGEYKLLPMDYEGNLSEEDTGKYLLEEDETTYSYYYLNNNSEKNFRHTLSEELEIIVVKNMKAVFIVYNTYETTHIDENLYKLCTFKPLNIHKETYTAYVPERAIVRSHYGNILARRK